MKTLIQFTSLLLAAICYAWLSMRTFYPDRFDGQWKFSFWGNQSDLRKYKRARGSNNAMYLTEPPKLRWYNRWYYAFFRIERREAFPFSATALVWLTDGYHFIQFWMLKFIFLAITQDPALYAGIWFAWSTMFSLALRYFKSSSEKIE